MGSHAVKHRNIGKNKKSGSHDQSSRRPDALDTNLRLILDSLAALLVSSGYGYTRLAKIAKLSFVEAARSIDRENDRKISIARIAALTGLTRTDVSQLLRNQDERSGYGVEPDNRALRVVRGWLTDSRYVRNGLPRRLPFNGSGSSFSNLVKKYSGDIPARAMLSEMKRLRMVRHDNNDQVLLVREKIGISKATLLTVRAISPWVEMLATGKGSSSFDELTSNTKQVRLNFSSSSQLLAAARELEHRRLAFVDGLEQLGEAGTGGRRHFLRVSIAVAAERSIQRAKRRRKKRAEIQ